MLNLVGELAIFLALAAGTPPAASDDVSISKVESKLRFWTDGKGHYLAAVPFGDSDERELFFYGDGKSFWQQRVIGWSADGDKAWDYTFWEPRVKARYQASYGFRDGKAVVQCEDRKTEVTPVGPDETKNLVAQAKFFKSRWKYRAYAIARDKTGKYYYVDRQREPEDNRNFRLFAGPRGNLKQLKMTNVVSDSEGDIFATKSGQLRMVIGKNESAWIQGKSETKLLLLPLEDNVVLIYRDLGVYVGQPLGTPCDDL
jgi:hypothetical protein